MLKYMLQTCDTDPRKVQNYKPLNTIKIQPLPIAFPVLHENAICSKIFKLNTDFITSQKLIHFSFKNKVTSQLKKTLNCVQHKAAVFI